MEKIYFDTLKETLYHEKMDNGLEVYLLPKQWFGKNLRVVFNQIRRY